MDSEFLSDQQRINERSSSVERDDWADIDCAAPSDSELEQLVRHFGSHPESE